MYVVLSTKNAPRGAMPFAVGRMSRSPLSSEYVTWVIGLVGHVVVARGCVVVCCFSLVLECCFIVAHLRVCSLLEPAGTFLPVVLLLEPAGTFLSVAMFGEFCQTEYGFCAVAFFFNMNVVEFS